MPLIMKVEFWSISLLLSNHNGGVIQTVQEAKKQKYFHILEEYKKLEKNIKFIATIRGGNCTIRTNKKYKYTYIYII